MSRQRTVWAPFADRVDLVMGDERRAMERADGGWWTIDDPLKAGDRYMFALNGGEPRPDPRSQDQPEGPHKASRVVDHDAYAWRHPDYRARPLAGAVIYEMHPGTFTGGGTLESAIERLDHLAELGITHVELMPLNTYDGERGWGYDGVNWFAPHRPTTGPDGPNAVKRFVDECHARDLAVVLDVVYNHLGPSGNYLSEFGPYFTGAYHTPWGDALNLDGPHSDEVRRSICDNALMWLREYKFDALRLDAVHAFHDRSATHILEQISREVHELAVETGRPLDVVAESDLNDPRVVRRPEAGGHGCDAQWSDDFHHALHALLTGERIGYYEDFGRMEHLARALTNAYVYDGAFSRHRHRTHGAPTTGLSGHRFLGYIQNHDQIGNRAQGDRLSAIVPEESMRTAHAIVFCSPFIPMIFQGEEWGATQPFQYFTDHHDPALAEAVRTGRRGEFASFGWDPEAIPDPNAVETFERCRLDWSDLDDERHRSILEWTRSLIRLRREHPELADGDMDAVDIAYSEDEGWIALRRGRVLLAANLSGEPRTIEEPMLPAPDGDAQRAWNVLMTTSDGNHWRADDGAAELTPGGSLILRIG